MFRRNSKTIKSILLLAGAFTFAFLLGEMIHEFGHYLSHLAYGNPGIRVHLDPYGGSRIEGVTSLPVEVLGVTSAAGPLFNLALGITCTLILWRRRKPILLPLLLWGPVAMIQEGVTFSLGLLTPGGDAQWVAAWGVPESLILLAGLALLLAGLGGVSSLLPLAGIDPRAPFWKKYVMVVLGMCLLMLLRSIHPFLAYPAASSENLIPLIFSLILAAIVVSAYEPIAKFVHRISLPTVLPVTWSAPALALILGAGMFTLQVAALN